MELKTPRLIITDLTPDMAQAVHENSLDEDTRRFVPDEVFDTPEAALEAINFLAETTRSLEGPLVYAALTREEKRNIGYVLLVPLDDNTWEIGYHIAKEYTGLGYATEAVRFFLPEAARLAGVSRIYGICLKENGASRRVMEKCGFSLLYEGPGPYQGRERTIVKCVWQAGAN